MKPPKTKLVERRALLGIKPIALATLSAMLSGCAALGSHRPPSAPPSYRLIPPGYTITSDTRPAVGEVIPVEIVPPQKEFTGSIRVITASFTAIDENGMRVPALSTREAAARVGDAGKLREAVTEEDSVALVAKEVFLGPAMAVVVAVGVGGQGGGIEAGAVAGALTFPVLTSYSIYNGARLATSSEQRLAAVSYPESRLLYLTTALRKEVFIYFPRDRYRRLETTLHLRLAGTDIESEQTVSQNWPAQVQHSDSIALK